MIRITFTLASWFTSTCINNVQHPIYGFHQVTPSQLVRAGNEYRKSLWAEIREAFDRGDITADQIEFYNNK